MIELSIYVRAELESKRDKKTQKINNVEVFGLHHYIYPGETRTTARKMSM